MPHSASKAQEQQTAAPKESSTTVLSSSVTGSSGQEGVKPAPPGQLAVQLTSVAIEGLTDEELSDSGGEGMYRERDEFVVKNEDTGSLKVGGMGGDLCETLAEIHIFFFFSPNAVSPDI